MEKPKKTTFLKRLLVGWSGRVTIILIALAVGGLYLGSHLQLKLSLFDLLPEDHPSVVKFEEITEIVGGVGFLTVVLTAENTKTHFRVLPQVVRELRQDPDVRSAFYSREDYFFSTRMLYYVPLKDLKKLRVDINKSIKHSRRRAFDLGLWDKEELKPVEVDSKVKETAKKSANVLPHLQSKDGKNVLLMVKPGFDSTDLAATKALVARTEGILQKHLPKEVKYEFAGRYFNKIADTEVIQEDIKVLGLLALGLIALLLLVYLRSVRAMVLIILPILVGIGITLGLGYLFIGHINVITGFLLGILMGLGADYSIHLTFRLRLEKLHPTNDKDSPVWRALFHSGHAIFVGALAASLAFYLLCFSDFRAFSEFGFICGTGIGAVMISLLLSFSGLTKALGLDKVGFAPPTSQRWLQLPTLSSKRSFGFAVVGTLALCVLATQVKFEYDFSKMLQHSERVQYLSKLVDEIYQRSVVPSVLAVPSKKEAVGVEDFVKEKYVPDVISNIVSGATIIPDDQREKQKILKLIRKDIKPYKDRWIEKELEISAKSVRRWVNASPFGFTDLPVHLQDLLRGKTQSSYLLYMYPNFKVELSTAQGVQTFASMVRDVEKNFPKVLTGSDAVVFAEILDLIKKDGLVILVALLSMVGLILWINLRRWEATLASFLPLIASFPIGMGLMSLLGIKFNIFNIAIIPSFVAIGIDVPLHVAHRAREIRSGFKAAKDLAGAVNLTLATTGIGFGVLIFPRAGVLRSLGWLALLGTLSIWWVGLFILPAILERYYQRKSAQRAQLESTSPEPPEGSSHQEIESNPISDEPIKTISP